MGGPVEAMPVAAITLVCIDSPSSWWATTPFFAEPPRPQSHARPTAVQARVRVVARNRAHDAGGAQRGRARLNRPVGASGTKMAAEWQPAASGSPPLGAMTPQRSKT